MVQDESSIFLLRLQEDKDFCTTFLVHVGHFINSMFMAFLTSVKNVLNVLKLIATVLTAKCVLLYTMLHRVPEMETRVRDLDSSRT